MGTLDTLVAEHEIWIRLSFFVGVLGLMALWELVSPRRTLESSKAPRWFSNLSLVGLNVVVLRVLFPAAAVGTAVVAGERGFGLFNQFALPAPAVFLLTLLALDLTLYLQHVMVHAVPVFWRLHRVHHADLDVDVTTGARFHPIEVLLSMVIKISVTALLGAPVAAVVVFEILLNATAMFNHGNVYLPPALDRILRYVVVTPDMHRVHHSIEADEANTNFGFNLPWWDRLFATYRDAPRAGQTNMTLGISTYREPEQCTSLWGMLSMPFRGQNREYVITRRAA